MIWFYKTYNNVNRDSAQQGWRLMTILTAYNDCSDVLKPYLFNYLEQNAYDQQRANQGQCSSDSKSLINTLSYLGLGMGTSNKVKSIIIANIK